MATKSPILVIHEQDSDQTARRFVALLCLMEFYVLFVTYGTGIWNSNGDFWTGPTNTSLYGEWTRIALLTSTAFLYLCGRGLWRGGRRHSLWLWTGIVGLSAIIVVEAVAAAIVSMNTDLSIQGLLSASPNRTLDVLWFGVQAASFHLPLWTALVILMLVTRANSRWRKNDKALWVYCAAGYCAGWVVAEIFERTAIAPAFGPIIGTALSNIGIQHAPFIAIVLVLLTTAVLLFRASPLARSTALMTATINAVAVGANWFVITWLVRVSTKALLYQVPFSTPVSTPYFGTKHDFMWLLVLPVHFVLPWLLIAGYAWRVPMRKPPDDGTPYPRRYCTNCHYNLFGNTADQCPECGHALRAATS
ncbi:MAG: hypothetical protein H6819_12460 [Phycisphaerales bacterium]|nr:hypothetical protein [Phycisphaerales bacterium]MCB9855191.1 hypothetical protein [Phycisphaerales bacterium]MCB9862784.1 hypothetical protein [Phycisphaerales bacterium]